MTEAFHYKAFISYSHQDRSWASWLHGKLENYPIGTALALESGKSSLRPIFRDEDELAASSDLSVSIRSALERSEYLIVVCSPAAVASKWVNSEIEHFRSLGREDAILCLLVEGSPEDSFPLALGGETEPLAANIGSSRSDRRKAVVRLAASLMDVDYASLEDRDARHRQMTFFRNSVVTALVIAVASGMTWYLSQETPCDNSDLKLVDVWNVKRVAELTSMGNASGPYVLGSVQKATKVLDDYAINFTSTHREACEATHVFNEQSSEMLDLRMGCMEERRLEFSSAVELLSEGNPEILRRSVDVANGLTDVAVCGDQSRLLRTHQLPEDPSEKESLDILRQQIAGLKARVDAGQGPSVIEEARVLLKEMNLDYPPLRSEMLFLLGRSLQDAGEFGEAASVVRKANTEYKRARNDEGVAKAWTKLAILSLQGGQFSFERADESIDFAEAELDRLEMNQPGLEAGIASARGSIELYRAKFVDAITYMETAVDIARKEKLPKLHDYLHNLVNILRQAGRYQDALSIAAEAREVVADQLGSGHPYNADFEWMFAVVLADSGDYDRAIDRSRRAIRTHKENFGSGHTGLLKRHSALSGWLTHVGRVEEARAEIDAAMSIHQSNQEDVSPIEVSVLFASLGYLKYLEGRSFEEVESDKLKAIKVASEAGNTFYAVSETGILGELANEMERPEEALEYCNKAIEMSYSMQLPHRHTPAFQLCKGIAYANLQTPNNQLALETLEAVLTSSTVDINILYGAVSIRAEIHAMLEHWELLEAEIKRAESIIEKNDEGKAFLGYLNSLNRPD